MKKLHKLALLTTVSILATSSAFANNKWLGFTGNFLTEGGVRKETLNTDYTQALKDTLPLGIINADYGLYSTGTIGARAVMSLENGLSYGANIALSMTHNNSGFGGSYAFIDGQLGRLEAGASSVASSRLAITGSSVASGIGSGTWSSYVNLNPWKGKVLTDGDVYASTSNDYAKYVNDFYGDIASSHDISWVNALQNASEEARSISYYTPVMAGFQVGASFIPDTSNNGQYGFLGENTTGTYTRGVFNKPTRAADITTVDTAIASYNTTNNLTGDSVKTVDAEYKGVKYIECVAKNVFAGGAKYSYSSPSGLGFNVSVVGEYGKVVENTPYNKKNSLDKATLKDPKTYTVGGSLTYNGFAIGGGYTDLKDSFTAENYDDQANLANTRTSIAAAFNEGPFGLSVTRLSTDRRKNTLKSITVAASYTLAPGLQPYVEYTNFDTKSQIVTLTDKDADWKLTEKEYKGSVFVLGTRLSF